MNINEYIIYPTYENKYLVGKVIETYPDYQDNNGIDMPGGYDVKVVFLFNWDENIEEKYVGNGAIVIKATKDTWKYKIIRHCLK